MSPFAAPLPSDAASRKQQYGALTASAVLHLVFALSIFASAKGTVTGGVTADYGDAVEVSLGGVEGAPAAASSPQAAAIQELFKRVRAQQSDLYSGPIAQPTRSSVAALFEEIERERRKTANGRLGTGRSDSGAGVADEPKPPSRQGEELSDEASSGELWGQIEPCWRMAPRASALPVTLEVELNDHGALARPPVILRPASASIDEPRLIAEARALAAVAACMPFRTVSLPGMRRSYRVEFIPRGR